MQTIPVSRCELLSVLVPALGRAYLSTRSEPRSLVAVEVFSGKRVVGDLEFDPWSDPVTDPLPPIGLTLVGAFSMRPLVRALPIARLCSAEADIVQKAAGAVGFGLGSQPIRFAFPELVDVGASYLVNPTNSLVRVLLNLQYL